VAKNDDYVAMANQMAEIALGTSSPEEFMAADFGGISIEEKLTEQTGVIGEKIEIGAYKTMEAPFVGSYIHGNKIAAVVGLSAEVDNAEVLAKDLAMQIASMGATTLSYKDFDADYIASETEARIAVIEKENIELGRLGKALKNVPKYISRAQLTDEVLAQAEADIKAELLAEGKPEQILDRIVPGKLERFISDNTTLDQEQCLLDQKFIKDDKLTVAEYVKTYGDVEVVSFERVSLS
jgi:elongation factor Ts